MVLLSALGFPPPVAPRQSIHPAQEQTEPARKRWVSTHGDDRACLRFAFARAYALGRAGSSIAAHDDDNGS
jgi:hypothetical protein